MVYCWIEAEKAIFQSFHVLIFVHFTFWAIQVFCVIGINL